MNHVFVTIFFSVEMCTNIVCSMTYDGDDDIHNTYIDLVFLLIFSALPCLGTIDVNIGNR